MFGEIALQRIKELPICRLLDKPVKRFHGSHALAIGQSPQQGSGSGPGAQHHSV